MPRAKPHLLSKADARRIWLHAQRLDTASPFGDGPEATRAAVNAWGLEILCSAPKAYSGALTAIVMPEGHDADAFRKVALENFNMSLGQGLTKVAGKVFRIGHLGDFNDLMLMGTLSGVEMALGLAKVPHKSGGVQAALTYLRDTAPGARQ